jgi:SAM-dependent methyltransferase
MNNEASSTSSIPSCGIADSIPAEVADIAAAANEETLQTWNELAQMYHDKFMTMTMYNDTYDAFLTNLNTSIEASYKDGVKILDIGCGPGVTAKYLLSHSNRSIRVTGIDTSPNMIALAQQNFPDHRWMVMDCRHILTKDGSQPWIQTENTNSDMIQTYFHGIMIGFCIPYLTDKEVENLFSDTFQLLYPHGVVYVSFVPGLTKKSEFKANKAGQRVYFQYHEEERIAMLLTNQSFTNIQRFYVEFPRPENQIEIHCIMIAMKQN